MLEDAGAQSLQWATAIDPGAPNESSQTVTFTTSNDNNVFSSQPTISPTGVLTYTPAANANGTTTVTVTAQDNGGTANGGHDSTTATFTITVTPVNDAPTLSPAADQSVSEDDGPQAVALTSISPGPADEASQTVTLTTSTDHPEYFDIAGEPSVAPDGTLTFTPAQGAFGTANVTVTAQDDGGTANGGQDTASISFQIVIAPLPPNAADDSYSTTVGTLLHVAAPGVLQNDADVNSSIPRRDPGHARDSPRLGHDQRGRIVRLPAVTALARRRNRLVHLHDHRRQRPDGDRHGHDLGLAGRTEHHHALPLDKRLGARRLGPFDIRTARGSRRCPTGTATGTRA